jgi:type I restriction enzyme, S subunit
VKRGPATTLADVCESVRYGYTASASLDACGPRFVRITDIVPDSIDWESVPYCEIDDSNKERFALAVGDILVARTGATVGYAKLIREQVDAVFASYLVRFRVDSTKADPGFVGRLVESNVYKAFVQSRVGGAAQPNASAPVLGSFEFPLPSRREQARIAEILNAYDALIENNRQRIAHLENAARLLYQEWFVRLRFPGHKNMRVTSGVPNGWEKKLLGSLVTVVMGQSPESRHYNEIGEGLPFHQGVADFGDRFVSHRIYTTALNRVASVGDILCSVRAPVGRLNITLQKIVIGRGLAALRSLSGNQSFLYYQLHTHFFKEDLIGSGAIFASVTKSEFKKQKLLTPPQRLIKSFEEISVPIDEQIRVLSLHIKKLEAARDILLPRLMSGEIQS